MGWMYLSISIFFEVTSTAGGQKYFESAVYKTLYQHLGRHFKTFTNVIYTKVFILVRLSLSDT
jgi:hypothetical protein